MFKIEKESRYLRSKEEDSYEKVCILLSFLFRPDIREPDHIVFYDSRGKSPEGGGGPDAGICGRTAICKGNGRGDPCGPEYGTGENETVEDEEQYFLVAEEGYLIVYDKGQETTELFTHMPLAEFPAKEQERLMAGIWFPTMAEIFSYLESYSS